MHRRFLYHLHLGNFAHNISQRIVLNYAIMYNETVRGGIYILLTIEFYAHVHSCAIDRFVFLTAIDNYKRIIMPKRQFDSARDNRIHNNFYKNVRTCRRESIICFYRNPNSYHRMITFQVQIELHIV